MERVKRTNIIIVNLNQWAEFISRHDPYAMNVDRGRNCYGCRGFGYIVRNCRN